MKTCFKCKKEKEPSEFYKHKAMADGHLGKCKQCAKDDVQNNYQKNINYYKEYDKMRSSLKHRVDKRVEWQKNNPHKYRAQKLIFRYIKSGKIQKPNSCSICYKDECRIVGHHPDYNKPEKVLWVCCSCHIRIHSAKPGGVVEYKEHKEKICL